MPNNAVERFKSFLEDVFRDRKTLIKILSIILILLTALVFRIHYSAANSTPVETADQETVVSDEDVSAGDGETADSLKVSEEIFVDIGGAVQKPGVYEVGPDTRLYEVIEMAGGLRDDADTNSVNQAAFVEDGQKIIIPVRIESDDAEENGSIPDNSASSDNTAAQSTAAVTGSGLVNINTAGREELMTLNGIGEVLADRIIEYRKSNVFRSKEDIMSVNGIGASKFDKIKDQIII